ncbi:MAG: restriction endonuclease subunit S [Saprospiraceae bacterium]|nr:restriction endonuclease subunit S [Saprospiraceae bacterium]
MQAGKFVSAAEIIEKPDAHLFPCYGGNGLRGYTKSFNHDGKYPLIGRQGALCGNVTLADGKFYATEHAVVVTLNNDVDAVWMFYLLTHLNLNQYATGQAQPGLSVQNLEKVEATIPKSKYEQQKIATVLSTIDERIQTQNKIIEELKSLKFTLSKKIFIRQLRFDNFNKDWKIKRLGEAGTFFSGGTPLTSQRHYYNGNIPFIKSGEINADYTEQFISEEGLKNSSAKMVEVGDLIYALYGATSGEVGISKIRGAINQAILCIRTPHINTIFLLNYLKFQKESILKTYLQGGQGNLSTEIIKSLEIPIPHPDEQIKIADMLSAIDNKLELETAILNLLTKQKKHLLQQMFI